MVTSRLLDAWFPVVATHLLLIFTLWYTKSHLLQQMDSRKGTMRGSSSSREAYSSLPRVASSNATSHGAQDRGDKKYEKRRWFPRPFRIFCTLCAALWSIAISFVLLCLLVDFSTEAPAKSQPRVRNSLQLHKDLEAEFRMLFQDPNHLDHRKYVTWLTTENYASFVAKNNDAFIDFFSHQCIWSQRLYPIWVDFARDVHHDNLAVAVGAVDCADQEKLCEKVGVTAFPILKWFVNGTITVPVYGGKRSNAAFLQFAKAQLGVSQVHHEIN